MAATTHRQAEDDENAASIVFMYLSEAGNASLTSLLREHMRIHPRTQIFTWIFPIPGICPASTEYIFSLPFRVFDYHSFFPETEN